MCLCVCVQAFHCLFPTSLKCFVLCVCFCFCYSIWMMCYASFIRNMVVFRCCYCYSRCQGMMANIFGILFIIGSSCTSKDVICLSFMEYICLLLILTYFSRFSLFKLLLLLVLMFFRSSTFSFQRYFNSYILVFFLSRLLRSL